MTNSKLTCLLFIFKLEIFIFYYIHIEEIKIDLCAFGTKKLLKQSCLFIINYPILWDCFQEKFDNSRARKFLIKIIIWLTLI